MRKSSFTTAAALALHVIACGSGPACADADEGANYAVSCTPTAAIWTTVDVENGDGGTGVEVPKGTFTRIFTCPVNGHIVRMNFSSIEQPDYHCGAVDDGTISVWVDAVKVIDKRNYDGYAECMGLPEARQIVYKIIVNRLMHLTICSNQGGDNDAKNCRVVDLSSRLVRHPSVSAMISRTPLSLNLVRSKDQICHILDEKLKGHMLDEADPIEAAYGTYSNTDDLTDRKSAIHSLDIDNDGVPDQLTVEAIDNTEISMDRLSWKAKGLGEPHAIDAAAVNGLDWQGNLVDFISIISYGNKTYFYKRDNSVGNALPHEAPDWWEAIAGTFPALTPTRHLLVAEPNGAFTEICSWAPTPRPEEFL